MKRQLASFDIYMVVSELQELLGSYIDKTYQLTRDELLIRVNNRKIKQKESIFVRNGEMICTTQKKFETPLKPTTFAMTLRKYILNGRITAITQHEFDRIINLKISKKEGEYTLIIEFFSDGNIILVNPDGKIILPLIKKHWAHRTIKSGSAYMPPPAQINPFNLSKDEFTDLLKKSEADLVRTLAVNVNLSGTYAEEICKRSGIERNTKIDKLTERNIEKVFIELSNFLELFKNKEFQPVLVKKDGKPIDILPFEFKSYENVDFEQVDRFTKNLQEFIGIKKKTKKQEESNAEKKLGKLNRQLLQQQGAVDELGEKIKRKKIEGELIYLNFRQCENLLNEITEVLEYKDKKEKIEKINEQELVKEFDPLSNMLVVYLPDTKENISEVNLDFRKSVAENAEKAYNDSKKYRNKLAGARDSIEKTKSLIESAKKKAVEEKEKKKKTATGKTFWFESFRWFISSDGNIVVGGKDIKSNDKVVKKYLKDGDRYAHADIHGASSCIVKRKDIDNKDLPISEKTLEETCIFSACHSKAWKQFTEAQAYWVLPEQVSKTPQSGEFVPKGAFIIRGKRNYYRCKLEFAVGEIMVGETRKIMGGPVEAVKKRASKYIVLIPGDMKKNVIAHKLAKALDAPVDQVDRVLPAGGVNIVETVGFELSMRKE